MTSDTKVLLKHTKIRNFHKGDAIIHEGAAPEDEMYFILEGEVTIYKNRPEGEHEIEKRSLGQFFGEMALIGNQFRLATARAASENVKIAVIDRVGFLNLCGRNPVFLFKLLKYAVSRLVAAETKLSRINKEIYDERQ
jgi:CRP-like cAMP-binding protein